MSFVHCALISCEVFQTPKNKYLPAQLMLDGFCDEHGPYGCN